MPTNRRYRTRQRREFTDAIKLTADLRHELLTGSNWFGGFGRDFEAMERAWEQHRDHLHREFVAMNPGRRPWAEWYFELIPEYGERELTEDGRLELARYGGDVGCLQHRKMRTEFLHTSGDLLQEPEFGYLKRHGLLERGELERRTILERMHPIVDLAGIRKCRLEWIQRAGLSVT